MRLRDMVVMTALCSPLGVACSRPAAPARPEAEPEAEPEAQPEQPTVDPEVYDKVKHAFQAKRTLIARCFSDALAAGTIDHKAKGAVTFEMSISPAGKATNVHTVKDSLKSPAVIECATGLITSWDLPKPATAMPFSFIYDFEEQ
jgi:hypothetical protein